MRRPFAVTIALVLVVSALAITLLPVHPAAADPTSTDNLDGTSDVVWNFSTPADYTTSNVRVAGGLATLRPQVSWWNSTTAADFAGPDGATNVDFTTYPGDIVLSSTSGTSTLLTIQPDPAAGLDAYLDRGSVNLNHGGDTTLVYDARGSTNRRPILQFSMASIPAGAVIDDAKLVLYMSAAAANPSSAEIHAVTPTWNEGQATWNDRLTGTPWTTAGGDYDARAIDVQSLNAVLGWKTWNVTQIVDLWYRNRVPNNGMILLGSAGGTNLDKTFWSSDYAADPTLRPKLDIRYRVLGATGEYISKVGGPGSLVAWQSISWNATERSYVSDEFNGGSLNPKWTWTNPPAAYDEGTTTPGSLHIVSSTGVDLDAGTFTGNVLANEVVGDFTAIAKISGNPTVSGQKAGLMVLLNNRNWYAAQKVNVAGTVNWQAKATTDSVSGIRANVASGNPIPAWFRIVRSGVSFAASTSSDGSTWTALDTYTPGMEYPLEVRLALFVADGLSGTAHTIDIDYIRVQISNDATAAVSTRLGNTSPVDGTWTGWSSPYATPSGSAMTGVSRYAEFRLSFAVTYPDHTPNIGDVNLSWSLYPASGTLTTQDFAPPDLSQWDSFAVVHTLNGQTIAYDYSTDSGGSWTSVSPPASLLSVSTATGKIRFRATLSTSNATITPTISEMRLGYRHLLDRFFVTASSTATAGASFTVTITAKDAGNATMTWWTGTVAIDARLPDGVTPGGGTLGTTTIAITAGGSTTLSTETYTKAETIRIRASFGSASGLSGLVAVSPGPLDHLSVTPNDVTILPFDGRDLSAQGYDAWDNPIAALAYSWAVTGGVGSLNVTTGPNVNFTASPPPANGTVVASVGAVTGVAQIHVVSGVLPWVAVASPTNGVHLTGAVLITYTFSADAASVRFEYNGGSGWTTLGTAAPPNGTFPWDTTPLNFVGGSLRAVATNNRTISNTTVVAPIEVDNTPPTITLGAVTDNQATSGTLTLTYATSSDVVRVDFTYFDGTSRVIGTDLTVDGSYVWTPSSPINGVTIHATAFDDVNLQGSAEKVGVGSRRIGTNPPTIAGIPTIHVRTGTPYGLNLTFYVTDLDTPFSGLTVSDADSANVSALGGPYPSLTITYATASTYVVTLWVSDGIDTAWTLLTIVAAGTYPPRVVATPPSVQFDEDTTAPNGLGAIATAFIDDPDGDPLVFTVLGNRSVHFRVNPNSTLDFWADPNWFGSEAVRLRGTDPSGGFAEVAFAVAVRSVDDPPILAAVPALSVEAGTTYVLDLDPYIADVDTPLASIAVTTDSPYVTVSGHRLTLAFPSDRTSARFNVTISDGTSAANREVSVAFHITPAWWQAPYILALPPIGVFVVVAMFAQRARWKPAKAFLVDEKGRMIREFTLDPGCQVTYDQAVQAGVLDAVEKPIKVTKYHGQTVRGDALAVVLLAYGPVTSEQVEFAREMLVQIQDKFEDAVKQRLEEARARDAELASRAQTLDERQSASEARAVEIESTLRQVQLAQTKIDADTGALAAKEQDLIRREQTLAEGRTAVDELSRQTEELRTSLDRRSAETQAQAAAVATRSDAVSAREDGAAKTETTLREKEAAVGEEDARLKAESVRLSAMSANLETSRQDLDRRESAVVRDVAGLTQDRQRFEADQKDLLELRRTLDERVVEVETAKREAAAKADDLARREERIQPVEAQLEAREAAVSEKESELQSLKAITDAASRELAERAKSVEDRETALSENRVVLEEARGAFDVERKDFQQRTAQYEDELRRRRVDLDAQAKDVGEAQLRLAHDKETFDTSRIERNQAILSKEIELESREQSTREKEEAIRSQAEESGRRLSELASREETLEIEEERTDKSRADLEVRKAELATLTRELDEKAAHLRDEEARRAEELRTWQKTLESQQALLKEQGDTFEKEMSDLRSSWADRVRRVEEREDTVKDLEEKVRTATERATKTDEELSRRETATAEATRQASELQAKADGVLREIEQRTLELDSRERTAREETARHAVELTDRTEALDTLERELSLRRSDFEQEQTTRTQRLQQMENEIQKNALAAELKARDLLERDTRIASTEETLREVEQRLQRERGDVQVETQQLEARQLELMHMKDRYDAEAARVRSEAEATRHALAAKEADLKAERERIERDSSMLQETLGAKAKEMAARERALSAREVDLRAEEQDLEARLRDLDTKERQAETMATELSARASLSSRREQDINERASQFDEMVKRFESEGAEKRRESETLQRDLRMQQGQMNATAEARAAELAKRMEEIDGRERSARAAMAQLDLERSKLESQAKTAASKASEADAAWQRSEARIAELRAGEDDLLRARQTFESERSVWSAKRAEELKQLEATRDAAGQQTQQAERLVAEAQRRIFVAQEAEKAAKRQADELVAQQDILEKRRADAEKAERDLQARIAQVNEASQKFATKELETNAAVKELEARQTKMTIAEHDLASASAEIRVRKTALDQESAQVTSLSDRLAARQREIDSRASALDARGAQLSTKEQTLTMELQRADNLMEDLAKKEREIRAREDAGRAAEAELSKRTVSLSAKDAELGEAMRSLERTRGELESQRAQIEEDGRVSFAARDEAETLKREAERLRAQADGMQAEVTKNLRFLQKKALEVLDQEEKMRAREGKIVERERGLDTRMEILEGKEGVVQSDRQELDAKTSKLTAEVERLRAKLAEMEKMGGPSGSALEDWRRDVESRVKIIQKKAMELLDREEKMRKKEEELRALAHQLGVEF